MGTTSGLVTSGLGTVLENMGTRERAAAMGTGKQSNRIIWLGTELIVGALGSQLMT